ncbi:MAG TPA: TonB family protein [Bryobacteraceae bacterium]|nr:TonB family protein [Bryobacteraceae bacterium]
METVVTPPESNAVELRLLAGLNDGGFHNRKAGVISLVVHVVGIAVLMMLPANYLAPPERNPQSARVITPLVAPPSEPTQTIPNKGPLSKEFDAEAMQPRPRIQVPPSPPSTTRAAAVRPSLPSPPPAPRPSLAEPPKLEARAEQPPPPVLTPSLTTPPRIQDQEKPALAFEDPGAARPAPAPGRIPGGLVTSGNTVDEAIRAVTRGGVGGGLSVGDAGEPGIGGIGEGINLPPSPGRQASNLELLSDPMGVDFRPYLIKVLASVRRNWFAVMPESAKLGRPGRVSIQFVIARNGSVPKLVIVGYSGTDAFDRAAVAGISASNPFPPLPTEFHGGQVRLQLNFSYNVRRR